MDNENREKIFFLELKGYTQTEIAKKLNIAPITVLRALKKIKQSREYEMGALSVEMFLDAFAQTGQAWSQSNMLLQELIDEVKNIQVQDDFDGVNNLHLHKSKYEKKMERIELIAKLQDKQDKNRERILTLASQGDLVMAIKAMKDILTKHAPSKPFILKRIEATTQ